MTDRRDDATLPKDARKSVLIGIVLISSAIAGINGVTGFSLEIIYRILYSSSSMEFVSAAMEGLMGIAYFTSFGVPAIIGTIYMWPSLMVAIGRGGEGAIRVAARRALNGPFMLGLCGITGWLAYSVVYFIGVYIHRMPSLTTTSLRLVVDSLFAGIMCFVLSYYLVESLTRKYYIGAFFPDGNLSSCEGAFALTIRERLIIYYFSVSLFPFLLFIEIFLSMLENYSGTISISGIGGLTIILTALGMWLTFVVAASYRKPLNLMRSATEKVGRGDYDVSVPVISNDETGNLSEAINGMAAGLREKERIKDTFGRMVDPRVRDHLLGGHDALGGRIVDTTILFTDIRGFTTLSENMPPEKVVELLNRYFEIMSPCVTEEQGIVNKFIGDSLMAIFGAPIPLENHAAAAVRAAGRMSAAMTQLNRELSSAGLPQIAHGVGIHSGAALVGNIGTGSRMEYTAIGDAVNTASRIQGLCKQFKTEILISETTLEKLDNAQEFEMLGESEIRGRNRLVRIYTPARSISPGFLR